MNLVLIISDTFRRDHVGAYGNKWIHTPTLDRLAEESVVFDRAYCASFPTLLCRMEMFTGRFVFPYLDWGPLPENEILLSEVLAGAGYTCTMVTDNLPLCRPRYGFDRGFHGRHRIRGQWYDEFQPADAPFHWPFAEEKVRKHDRPRIEQYLRNVAIRRGEEDWFAPQVVREAIHWLEENHDRGRFFLYVDLFDPHQPWDPPDEYTDLYDPGDGDQLIYPIYGQEKLYDPADLRRMKALYRGEVTLVDRWLGRFLQALDDLGRRDDTAVAFLSDHGIFLGERGLVGKTSGRRHWLRGWPTYSEVARVPFMLRVPGIPPGRRRAMVHPGDLAPTFVELAGATVPPSMKTRSLLPVLRGEAEEVRDLAVSSWALHRGSPYRPSVIRTDEWALVEWRSGMAPELYHLPSDPDERTDVIREHPEVAADLHRRYLRFLRENDCPLKNLLPRLLLGRPGGSGGDDRFWAEEDRVSR